MSANNKDTFNDHKRLLALALPLIIANITTPLLGLVDTAILGRMQSVEILAGAAIASLIITQLYWICGFLKMSVTGLSAQAVSSSTQQSLKVIVQGLWLGLFISILLLLFHKVILQIGLDLAGMQVKETQKPTDTEVAQNAVRYFEMRIIGAPAAICNMAVIGWLIGQQKTKQVLFMQVVINVTNIVFSLLFVYVFGLGVEGVAGATVVAEYLMLGLGIALVFRHLQQNLIRASNIDNNLGDTKPASIKYDPTILSNRDSLKSDPVEGNSAPENLDNLSYHPYINNSNNPSLSTEIANNFKGWISPTSLKQLVALNSHIFFRNLALQFTLAFVTFTGARYGATAVAVNAILMQFFALIALGLDGVANAVEALVGEAKGLKDRILLNNQVKIGLMWSSLIAVVYAVLFYFTDNIVVMALTAHAEVINAMIDYQWVIVIMPLIAHWCFLFDGVFVGLGLGKPMRDTMILSAFFGFLLTWWVCISIPVEPINLSLWIAMLIFVLCRGAFLGGYYWYCYKADIQKLLA